VGDVVYVADLEQSIRYALTVEIPTQQFLDEAKMKAIYQATIFDVFSYR
jgi:hypothetical protein